MVVFLEGFIVVLQIYMNSIKTNGEDQVFKNIITASQECSINKPSMQIKATDVQ